MTRIHAARVLFSLGPLSLGEFVEITGWPYKTCRHVLTKLVDEKGELVRDGGLYRVSSGGI